MRVEFSSPFGAFWKGLYRHEITSKRVASYFVKRTHNRSCDGWRRASFYVDQFWPNIHSKITSYIWCWNSSMRATQRDYDGRVESAAAFLITCTLWREYWLTTFDLDLAFLSVVWIQGEIHRAGQGQREPAPLFRQEKERKKKDDVSIIDCMGDPSQHRHCTHKSDTSQEQPVCTAVVCWPRPSCQSNACNN